MIDQFYNIGSYISRSSLDQISISEITDKKKYVGRNYKDKSKIIPSKAHKYNFQIRRNPFSRPELNQARSISTDLRLMRGIKKTILSPKFRRTPSNKDLVTFSPRGFRLG